MMPTTVHEPVTVRYAQAAAEIAGLANSNISADVFVKGLLDRVVAALGARAAGLWGLSSQGVLALAGEINLAETGVTHDAGKSRLNIRRLMDVSASSQAIVHAAEAPARGAAPEFAASNFAASNFSVLMAPVSTKKRCVGVLEVFLDDQLSREEWTDARQFVEGICS